MTDTVTATSSRGPTVVDVRILLWPDCDPQEKRALVLELKHRWSSAGPTPSDRGEIWELFLGESDLPDSLNALDALLWHSDAVRKVVFTYA